MKEYDVNRLLSDEQLVESLVKNFMNEAILKKQPEDVYEITGHINKAEHNLRFVMENIKLGFIDWAITGCYYASYHAALSLLMKAGYSSKNHLATLCILIQKYYKKELNKEDLEIVAHFLDYQDILFYVESKNKREDAAYSTKVKFEKKEVEQLRIKAALFVSKVKSILFNPQ